MSARFIRRARIWGDGMRIGGGRRRDDDEGEGEVVATLPAGDYRCTEDSVGFHVKRGNHLITFAEGKYRAVEGDDGTVQIEYLGPNAFEVHKPHAPERVHDRCAGVIVQNSRLDNPVEQRAQLCALNARHREFWRDRQR